MRTLEVDLEDVCGCDYHRCPLAMDCRAVGHRCPAVHNPDPMNGRMVPAPCPEDASFDNPYGDGRARVDCPLRFGGVMVTALDTDQGET